MSPGGSVSVDRETITHVTVVLALRCADGLVIASDSQITDPGRGLSYPAQKLHPLGKRSLGW